VGKSISYRPNNYKQFVKYNDLFIFVHIHLEYTSVFYEQINDDDDDDDDDEYNIQYYNNLIMNNNNINDNILGFVYDRLSTDKSPLKSAITTVA